MKWTEIRLKTKKDVQALLDEYPGPMLVEDIDYMLIPRERLYVLEEREKRLIEIHTCLDANPDLERDLKIAKIRLEYESKALEKSK